MRTFLVVSFLTDSFDIFHDFSSSGRPDGEPSDAADNEDASDLSKCHKDFRVVFRGRRAAAEALRAENETVMKQKQSRHVL